MEPDSPQLRLCESHMNYYSDHPDVLFHLMPLRTNSAPERSPRKPPRGGAKKHSGKTVHHDQNKKQNPADGKPAYTPIFVPPGCAIVYNNGKPICKKFNVGRCKVKTAKGGRCSNGFHVCWKEGCHLPFSFQECRHNE